MNKKKSASRSGALISAAMVRRTLMTNVRDNEVLGENIERFIGKNCLLHMSYCYILDIPAAFNGLTISLFVVKGDDTHTVPFNYL